jgi:predicted SprT family Zn-dependent metalloprotease
MLGSISGAAGVKILSLKEPELVKQIKSHVISSEFQTILRQELSHLKEHIYEKGYNPKTEETLLAASKEEQAKWNAEKSELLKKDIDMDHAAT